jgi:predicted enzyme related to lactoylglutathione lyase
MNKVVHFEIPANDIERAKKFYREIFGWNIQDWPMPNGSVYTGVRTVEIDEKTFLPKEVGAINGAIVKKDEIVKTPVVTVNVSSIDECVEKIIKAGGKLLKPKVEITGLGYYAYVQDTEGNLLALWQTLM